MTDFSRDPIHNAIQNGIKEDIAVTFKHGRFRACVLLIYAGMDAMAFLDMPDGQVEVRREDFIRWADRYMRFPCVNQITGADFYGARCSMLHAYGAVSRMSRAGECRMIGYMDKSIPEVRYNPQVATDLVLVSVAAIKDAFFCAIDEFLVAAFTDIAKKPIVESRLTNFVLFLPAQPGADES